jgi:hypothetical protein
MSDADNQKVTEQKSLVDDKTVDKSIDPRLDKEEQQAAQEYGHKEDKSGVNVMHVQVSSPFRDYFNDQAFSISATNGTGPFDILPKHHSFISLLVPCELTVRSARDDAEGPIRINISGGLMHVKEDEVIVFLDV